MNTWNYSKNLMHQVSLGKVESKTSSWHLPLIQLVCVSCSILSSAHHLQQLLSSSLLSLSVTLCEPWTPITNSNYCTSGTSQICCNPVICFHIVTRESSGPVWFHPIKSSASQYCCSIWYHLFFYNVRPTHFEHATILGFCGFF